MDEPLKGRRSEPEESILGYSEFQTGSGVYSARGIYERKGNNRQNNGWWDMKITAIIALGSALLFGGFLKQTIDPNSAIPEASDVIEYIQKVSK